MLSIFAILFLIPLVSSLSLHRHKRIATSNTAPLQGKFDTVTVGQYSLLNNLWGEQDATSGSQYSHLISSNDPTVSWMTSWTWTGGPTNVKSFANIWLNAGINQQLSAITSMPTTWEWSYQTTGDVATDVAYDLFTSWSPSGSGVNEIMIWMANINAGPISTTYNAQGDPVPIASNVSLAGQTWNLYSGYNGVNQVYSYLLTDGTYLETFSEDIYPFITYLIDNEGLSSSQYLTTAQAGTEAFTGTAVFTTWAYSLAIN